MENLIFSLNATIPIFLMMLLGMLFRKLGWMDEVFAAKMNKFVFLVPLPVLLFEQLATVDFSEVWDIKFILFCFVVTAIIQTSSLLPLEKVTLKHTIIALFHTTLRHYCNISSS